VLAITVQVDKDRGFVTVSPAAWPWLRLNLTPEVATELSTHLINRVNDLK
jgi:hypothetical protein